jgi:Fe-S cluster biogenesis protein NfuA
MSFSLIRTLLGRLEKEAGPEAGQQGPLYPAVREAITEVQAYARSHGGDIELVSVSDEGEVTIRLRGACRSCPMSAFTLRYGVEEQLRALVPGVGKIKQI